MRHGQPIGALQHLLRDARFDHEPSVPQDRKHLDQDGAGLRRDAAHKQEGQFHRSPPVGATGASRGSPLTTRSAAAKMWSARRRAAFGTPLNPGKLEMSTTYGWPSLSMMSRP